jgi:hypothetical protein
MVKTILYQFFYALIEAAAAQFNSLPKIDPRN